jgi:probable phosphoglycerate mutase
VARLHLVRHAQAAAGWGEGELDPALSPAGRAQAEALAGRLGPGGPLPLVTSPRRRARETAAALEARWGTLAIVEPAVDEVPAPSDEPAERQAWLRRAMSSTWTGLGPRYASWRTMVTSMLAGLDEDTVVVTHFVVINAALGAALGRDDVWVANVANASVTLIDNTGGQLRALDGPPPAPAAGRPPERREADDPGPVL